MKLNSIMFPTDFSESSDAALGYASVLAAETGATLHIVHVADDSAAYMAGYGGLAYVPEFPAELEKEMRGRLDEVKPSKPGVDVKRHYVTGNEVNEIVAFADREQVELIVMGTHGRTGVSRVLLGSVAEGVLRRAACPVLTVKSPMELDDEDETTETSRPRSHSPPRTRFSLH